MERISFQGYNNNYATFKISGTVKNGYAVSLDENGLCVKGSEGNPILGFCVGVRGSYATVQLQGYYECGFTGDVPEYGINKLVYDGNSGVAVAEDTEGTCVKVVKIDEDNSTVGFIF